MLDLFSEYKAIIKNVRVLSYEKEGDIYRSIVHLEFIDNSVLYVKEYVFGNNERKYAYHWADLDGRLICRWDNASHWPNISTFPHHKHSDNKVFESTETSIDDVLKIISQELKKLTE